PPDLGRPRGPERPRAGHRRRPLAPRRGRRRRVRSSARHRYGPGRRRRPRREHPGRGAPPDRARRPRRPARALPVTLQLALPAGDARAAVGALLAGAGIVTSGYEPESRVLRSVNPDDGTTLRVFREKDIPIQVALGNYHLGICGDVWLEELAVRFPLQHVV